jgi:DNA-binding FadR family transcriptional regulator
LIERETARLAASGTREKDLQELTTLLKTGQAIDHEDSLALVAYDFAFHQQIAILSGNLMYLLLINSLKSVHSNLAGIFYRAYAASQVLDQVFVFHSELVNAIQKNQAEKAAQTMADMLEHGEEHLLRSLPQE